ncbi:hypothetical protein LAZ67_5002300 [Cordylochernes scorpioides]|uniref:Uncharacterized protein n=1 Tax=Cordylochernes scorpioides TaxID=51811 RepID=A0ABY6KJU1_9ARAC|nr:hypothetical protein LAZ67_5002300 [Cordylochernes scorpioides]
MDLRYGYCQIGVDEKEYNLSSVSYEHGARFHQDISSMEKLYQGAAYSRVDKTIASRSFIEDLREFIFDLVRIGHTAPLAARALPL